MTRWHRLLLFGMCALVLPLPAFAQGEVRIRQTDGSSKTYPGVRITETGDTITFALPSADHKLIVGASNCTRENGLRVCSGTDLWFDRYGVSEELQITKGYVFINDTRHVLHIARSRLDLSPNTLLVEILTKHGTYITGRGAVDSTGAP